VRVHQLPCRPQNHADAFTAVVYEISENDSEALEGVSLDVKKLFGVALDYLEKDGHPLVECLVEALFNKLIVDTVGPTD
jgi:hypothetical protein